MASQGHGSYDYDVFLVHSSDDEDKARHIDEALQDKGLITFAHYRSEDVAGFSVGKFVFDNVTYAINYSELVLILVTPNAVESGWVTFEIIRSLEKSLEKKEMCVRLLFQGMSDEDIKQFMVGDFAYIPYMVLDFNKESWKTDLLAKIREPNPNLKDVLPVGNVAHGLVFNYFAGFLRNVLPRLLETVENTSYHRDHVMLKKFVVVIPSSCKLMPIEGEYGDTTITKMKESVEITASHGDKFRPYNLSVYSIKKGDKTFYFTAECPFIIATISKISDFVKMGPSFSKLQVERFRKTLMELVNHRGNLSCNNTVCFVDFNDTSTGRTVTLGDKLWNAIAAETDKTGGANTVSKGFVKSESEQDLDDKKYKYFATITMNEDYCESDQNTASAIEKYLSDRDVKYTNGNGGYRKLEVLDEAKWNVFVLSKETSKNETLIMQLNSALQQSVDNDLVTVIPIVCKDTEIRDIPDHLKWVTLLQEKEDGSHLDHMWDIMNGEPRAMRECMPSGPVYQGLAYTYILNYIAVGLCTKTAEGRVFQERFQDAVKKFKLDCLCIPRVFLITAASCKFLPPGSPLPNEKFIGDLEPGRDGPRKYDLKLYELSMKNGKKVCYAREFTTPAVTLHEMAHKYPFAGMNEDDMKDQAEKFVSLCRSIISDETFKSHKDIQDKCVLVYYDDSVEEMRDALERELQTFLDKGEYISP